MNRRGMFTRNARSPFHDASISADVHSDIPVDVIVFIKKNVQHHAKQRRPRVLKTISKYCDLKKNDSDVHRVRRSAFDDNIDAVSSEEDVLPSKFDMVVQPSSMSKYYDAELDAVNEVDMQTRRIPVRLRSTVQDNNLPHVGNEYIAIPANWKFCKPGMYLVDTGEQSPTDSVFYFGKSLSDEDLLVTEDDVFSVASTHSKYYDSGVDVSDADSQRKSSSNGNSVDTNVSSFGSMGSIHSDCDVARATDVEPPAKKDSKSRLTDDMIIPISDEHLVSSYVPSYYRTRNATLNIDTSAQNNAHALDNRATLSRRMQRKDSNDTSYSTGSNSNSSTRSDLAPSSINESTPYLDPESRDSSMQRHLRPESIMTSIQRDNPVSREVLMQRHNLHPVSRETSLHRNELHPVNRDTSMQRHDLHTVNRKTSTQTDNLHPVRRETSMERDDIHTKNRETSIHELHPVSIDFPTPKHEQKLRKQLISEKVLYMIRGTPNIHLYPLTSSSLDSHDMTHESSIVDFGDVSSSTLTAESARPESIPLCTKPPLGTSAKHCEKGPPKMRDINTIMHEITSLKANLYSSLLNLHLLNENSSLANNDVTCLHRGP